MASDWRKSTWGEEISLEYGKRLQGYKDGVGKYRVYGSNGPVGWTDKPLAPGPGVILGRKGANRGVEFSQHPFFVIDTAYYVNPIKELDMRWLYYAIIHYRLGEINDGSPIPSTTRSAVYVSNLQVPLFSEQKAITHILGPLDDKIELNCQMNETLEAMAQALFKNWFVDFDPVIDNALAAGNPIPDEFAERAEQRKGLEKKDNSDIQTLFPNAFEFTEEMGWIPKGWSVGTVEDVVKRLKSKRSYNKKDVLEHGEVPVYEQGAKILLGYHNNEPDIEAQINEPAFIFGDHTCINKLSLEPFSISSNVIPLIGKIYPTLWVYYAVKDKQSFEEYRRHWMEFIIKPVILPSLEVTELFSEYIKSFQVKQMKIQHQNSDLAKLRDTLLPKLMSGELRIPEAAVLVDEVL